VAAEAGWSLGSLRHYLDSQGQLLRFAMDLVVQRVTQRLAALSPQADPLATAASLLHQFLPLDSDRRAEMEVWLAFASRALVDPNLRELRDETHAAVRGVCRQAVELIGASRPDLEAERVHALVDGLAQHAIVAHDVTTPARQREILAAHLDSLRVSHSAVPTGQAIDQAHTLDGGTDDAGTPEDRSDRSDRPAGTAPRRRARGSGP
jgi:AcrR family transcriptional regulator